MIPTSTIAAPAARGMRCAPSQPTSGEATVATISPATTGSTIVAVAAANQTIPTSRNATPASSHEAIPRSRSHFGAENTFESWLS